MAFTRWLVLSGLAVVAILAVGPHRRGPVGDAQVAVPSWAHVTPEQIAEAKKYGVPVAFENSIGMRFVLIPAGTFLMGSPAEEEGRDEDEAQHEVVLTKPFYLGVTEVTNAQFRRFRADHDSGSFRDQILYGGAQPVVMVSWDEAKGFADWLSGQEGGKTYRLPTEAEWEYACRAGTKTRFWWGDADAEGWKYANAFDPKTKEEFGYDWDVWPEDDGYRVTAPVGSYPSNPWGLYDMLGNVWEWCQDWYGEYASGRVTDPSGPASGEDRMLRGGSWVGVPGSVRSALRLGGVPDTRFPDDGFRLVSPLPASR